MAVGIGRFDFIATICQKNGAGCKRATAWFEGEMEDGKFVGIFKGHHRVLVIRNNAIIEFPRREKEGNRQYSTDLNQLNRKLEEELSNEIRFDGESIAIANEIDVKVWLRRIEDSEIEIGNNLITNLEDLSGEIAWKIEAKRDLRENGKGIKALVEFIPKIEEIEGGKSFLTTFASIGANIGKNTIVLFELNSENNWTATGSKQSASVKEFQKIYELVQRAIKARAVEDPAKNPILTVPVFSYRIPYYYKRIEAQSE